LAGALGYVSGTPEQNVAGAIGSLGLERRWLVRRVGAHGG